MDDLGELRALVTTALDASLGHIRTHKGLIVGLGAPTHVAPEGTEYWDKTNDLYYINNDGATGWTNIAGSGGGHTEDHSHDGTPTQKLLAANTHETPSANTHHTKYADAEALAAVPFLFYIPLGSAEDGSAVTP